LTARRRRDEEVHLKDYYSIVFNRRWLILSVTLLVLTVAIAYSLVVPPVYEATTTLRIEPPASDNPLYLGAQNLSLVRQNGFLETEMEVLKSRTLAEKVVSRLGLSVEVTEPRMSRTALFSDLTVGPEAPTGEYLIELDGTGGYRMMHRESPLVVESRVGSRVELPGLAFRLSPRMEEIPDAITIEVLEYAEAVRGFMRRIRVEPIRDTRIIQLTISANDPGEARHITNTLASTFVDEGLSYKRLEAKNLRTFLEDQLEVVSRHLEDSEHSLEAFKERNQVVVLDVEAKKKIEKLAEFEAKLTRVRAERDGIRKLLDDVAEIDPAALAHGMARGGYEEIDGTSLP